MRHRMLAIFIAALALSLPLAAQDEAPAEAAAPPADAPPAAATPPAETPPTEPVGAAEARRRAADEDNDFVPTQDIEPDEEVVFPVNF